MSKLFVERDYYADRTPRSCAFDLVPAKHRVMKEAKDGRPDKSSARPVCDSCITAVPEQKAA